MLDTVRVLIFNIRFLQDTDHVSSQLPFTFVHVFPFLQGDSVEVRDTVKVIIFNISFLQDIDGHGSSQHPFILYVYFHHFFESIP